MDDGRKNRPFDDSFAIHPKSPEINIYNSNYFINYQFYLHKELHKGRCQISMEGRRDEQRDLQEYSSNRDYYTIHYKNISDNILIIPSDVDLGDEHNRNYH